MYKIVQIGVSFDYTEFICEQIKDSNPNFYFCKDLYQSLTGIKKAIFQIHNSKTINSRIHIPGKKMWAPYTICDDIIGVDHDEEICFLYQGGDHYFEIGAFEYLRSRYRNCILIYRYNDLVSLNEKLYPGFLNRCKQSFDAIMTYNAEDAEKYGLILERPKVLDYSSITNEHFCKPSDLFFVGRNKGRLKQLIQLFEDCKSNGLVCDFTIVDVEKKDQAYHDEITYNRFIPYKEMLSRIKRSKCVLNLIQDGAKGITMRDYESIGMRKMLLTNNSFIKSTDLYDEKHVMFLDSINFDMIRSYKETLWNNTEEYSIENYNKWFEQLLIDIKNRSE